MSLADKLRQKGAKDQASRNQPLWTGPNGEGANGGISYSLLSRFLVCRERFRIHAIEGLRPAPRFEPRMEYGSMWHVCEESYAGAGDFSTGAKKLLADNLWKARLADFCKNLSKTYQGQQQLIDHWYRMCLAQFPLYVEYWQHHDKISKDTKMTPLVQEQVFDAWYALPSGRKVRLRGRWDSIFERDGKLWIQENKTKSQINLLQVEKQLSFDLQTMIYVVALQNAQSVLKLHLGEGKLPPIAGVRYNVVRRSAHKSPESMVTKIQEDGASGRISEWFARLDTTISAKDIETFKHQFLHPCLENLYDWWEATTNNKDQFKQGSHYSCALHWRHPYGVRNILDEGGASDLDNYIATGSTVGLVRMESLFPELETL